MPNLCSKQEVRGCPASFYLTCPAYKAGENCWEADEKPCCTATREQCKDCATYIKAGEYQGGARVRS